LCSSTTRVNAGVYFLLVDRSRELRLSITTQLHMFVNSFDISYEQIIEVDNLKNELCIISYVFLNRSCRVDETA
ncbi:putative ankyrin repeat protein, partial [Trichinella spiralis]|uniref:putative ankyrin repeat protein n=1 Tax=Trichinella spiralis TaxID=6334 RepID=UPI0001EFE056